MAKRETAASQTRRATDKQKAAGAQNLAKGRQKKAKAREEAKTKGKPTATERWAQLVDGQLTVAELDDEELRRMKVRSLDGTFNGPRPSRMPSHLAQAFHQEAIKRANDKLRTAAPEAVQALLDIGRDPDVKESDRVRALMYVVDRSLGKTPETVRIEGQSKFDRMLSEALDLDRDLADDAGQNG